MKTIRVSQIILFLISIPILSCSIRFDDSSANLLLFNSASKKTFSFVVSEKFVKNHSKSNPSALYPKMNVRELKLLKKLLSRDKYCINQSGNLSFKINSKQEKIYDITFSSLIEKSYNARPISPVTYFGECLD
ncbi:MAG: hypothetical protein ACJA02_000541 [Myxococcota bacterium]|jgi:hypothetical protein